MMAGLRLLQMILHEYKDAQQFLHYRGGCFRKWNRLFYYPVLFMNSVCVCITDISMCVPPSLVIFISFVVHGLVTVCVKGSINKLPSLRTSGNASSIHWCPVSVLGGHWSSAIYGCRDCHLPWCTCTVHDSNCCPSLPHWGWSAPQHHCSRLGINCV